MILNDLNNATQLILDIKTKYFTIADETLDVVVFKPQNLTEEQKDFLNLIDKIKLN